MNVEASTTVAFRLDPVTLKRLDEMGIAVGKTRGDMARDLVKQSLGESRRLMEAVESVRVSVARLEARGSRDSESVEKLIRLSVAGLLVVLGRYTEEKAAQWVEFYLSGSDDT